MLTENMSISRASVTISLSHTTRLTNKQFNLLTFSLV